MAETTIEAAARTTHFILAVLRGPRRDPRCAGCIATFVETANSYGFFSSPTARVTAAATAAVPALKFSIVLPTYNEAAGIEQLIATVSDIFRTRGLDGEIIVVDDNSPDGTGAIVDALADRYPVRCLHRPGKMGLSSGVIDGWKFARPESDAVGAMDADFSHDPKVIPDMVAALASGTYGLAIGSRYVAGGGIQNWPLKRKITSLVAIALAKPLTPVRDITSGFFLVRRSALEGVQLDPIGFKIGLEVIAKAHYGRVLEVPYVFTDRVAGMSKLNQGEIFNYLRQLRRIYAARLLGRR
jgi:dolichol-phosphate mannosyltransferase